MSKFTELEKMYAKALIDDLPPNVFADQVLRLFDVGDSSAHFGESIKLLRDLADLQNGAPLEQHRKEWEETIDQVYNFLNRWESQ